jgi:NTP pyrophosphatase (non-canonical NTP hydrolase)
MDKFDNAIELVREERKRQFAKWGNQDHDLFTWLAILMEEVGEASQAALHQTFGGHAKGTFGIEMIHIAAVAVQIIEWILENE